MCRRDGLFECKDWLSCGLLIVYELMMFYVLRLTGNSNGASI
jgi:hypothetical protein